MKRAEEYLANKSWKEMSGGQPLVLLSDALEAINQARKDALDEFLHSDAAKEYCANFYWWWSNQKGCNTLQGYQQWLESEKGKESILKLKDEIE